MEKLAQLFLFDLVDRPEGLDDTIVLSITQEDMMSFEQFPLFNLVGRPEGLDDTVVLSMMQEDMTSFEQLHLLDRFIVRGQVLDLDSVARKLRSAISPPPRSFRLPCPRCDPAKSSTKR